jgi:hypothetical protein
VPKPDASKHISFMACVNAEGKDTTPIMMFQGVRPLARYTQAWPECLLGMSPSGYMTKEAFLAWCIRFEEATRPSDPDEWRCLCFDGHFSHLVVDAMRFLREHKVRVATVHPHTTHLCCVLDNGPFKEFNSKLSEQIALHTTTGRAVGDADVAGMVMRAWRAVLAMKVDPETGAEYNAITSGFKKTGLFPFSRVLADKAATNANELWKQRRDAAGVEAKPTPARPQLTLTPDAIAVIRAQCLHDVVVDEGTLKAIASAPRTQMAELLTSDEWLKKTAEAEAAAKAKVDEKETKAKLKEQLKAARGGLSKVEFEKQQKKAQKAAKAAAEAEEAKAAAEGPAAAAPAPGTLAAPPAAAKGGRKRKHRGAGVAGDEGGNIYAKEFSSKKVRG